MSSAIAAMPAASSRATASLRDAFRTRPPASAPAADESASPATGPKPFGRFADVLERHRAAAADAREPARELVAETFVRPILARIRESNDAAPPFAPGAIEKRFGPLIDEVLADRIVGGANMPIVDAVAREIVRRGSGGVA